MLASPPGPFGIGGDGAFAMMYFVVVVEFLGLESECGGSVC